MATKKKTEIRKATAKQIADFVKLLDGYCLTTRQSQTIKRAVERAVRRTAPKPASKRTARPATALPDPLASYDPSIVAFWIERLSRERAEIIVPIVSRFYNWKPELKPATPGLEDRVKTVLTDIGLNVNGVRVFTKSEENALSNALTSALGDALKNALRDALWDALDDALWNTLGNALRDALSCALRYALWNTLWHALCGALFYTTGFAIAGDTARVEKLTKLLDLFYEGYDVIGFDKNDNALVLVADPVAVTV